MERVYKKLKQGHKKCGLDTKWILGSETQAVSNILTVNVDSNKMWKFDLLISRLSDVYIDMSSKKERAYFLFYC